MYDQEGFEGAKYVLTPPLRDKWHQEELWKGLRRNDLQVVSTDHCAFRFSDQKTLGVDDFSKIPNGGPGIENRLSLLYTHGVASGLMDLNRLVELFSTNPARLFGLFPRKGTIAVGSDADIVVFDPDAETVISARPISSSSTARSRKSPPVPPYCSGNGTPVQPRLIICRQRPFGYPRSSSSISRTKVAGHSRDRNSRALVFSICWISLRPRSMALASSTIEW